MKYDHNEYGILRVLTQDDTSGVVYAESESRTVAGTDIPETYRIPVAEFEASTDPVDQTIGASAASIHTSDS